MSIPRAHSHRAPHPLAVGALVVAAAIAVGMSCNDNRPGVGAQLFTSPQANPIALSADGSVLYVANTTAGTLTLFDAAAPHARIATITVGMDPVGVAVRPKVVPGDPQEDELILVTNHISDSISVVSRQRLEVVQTLQELDGDGLSLTNEPVGVAFDGPTRAFVSLDHPNQVIGIEFDGQGVASLSEDRATLTNQAPRALTVANGRVYVPSFESGNQSEFTSCGPGGGPAYDPNGHGGDGTGCEFPLNLGTLVAFATSPNIGGEVVHNGLIPDRDLFVYDAADFFDGDGTPESVASVDVVETLGTLLYGIEAIGETLYITHTDARNKKDGLDALANRMFDNRLAIVACPGGSCGAPALVDLEANGFGVPVPTPYGIRAADDGAVLVASVAGSDGVPADLGDPSTIDVDIPGLVTLDAAGNVLGHVQTGAIPQGLALLSDGGGAAATAFVLNTVDNSVSVVDVSTPASPSVSATFSAGFDPTPGDVRAGRIAFSSARASTSGTFSCESCHPNSNIDQILWTINSPLGPEDACGGAVACPEPRSTMPIRGLRDTLPLHWVGNLADPFAGAGVGPPEDPAAPDCDLGTDGEVGCIRHLVDGSLSGVMCDQSPSCASGPSGQDGALDDTERDHMAAFMAAVAYPPGPTRRPTDVLSASATTGISDFYLDNGGLGAVLGGAVTCASDEGGCHALPLTVATNSPVVGGFDAPTIRGLWDRHVTFSNGLTSSEDALTEAGFDPKPGGMTELGSLSATFPGLFTLVYGVPVTDIWSLINEQSVGLPGLTGRQVDLTPDNRFDAGITAQLAQIELAGDDRKITAEARSALRSYRYKGTTGLWTPKTGPAISGDDLRDLAVNDDATIVVTVRLPQAMSIGGLDRQPLLSADEIQDTTGSSDTITVTQQYVNANAAVWVDGIPCDDCSIALAGSDIDITIDPVPAPNGTHIVQVHNPDGYQSNEMPFCVNGACDDGF